MKIEKINENKIKVTISLSDLEERNIDIGTLNYNSPATQELFWEMMEQAESELGFSTSDSQLCIEAFSDSEEGFTVTITKLDSDGDFESIQKFIKAKYSKKDIRPKRKARKVVSGLLLYAFESFEDLCSAGNKISSLYKGESRLHKCRDTYYLELQKKNTDLNPLNILEHMLSEFGDKVLNTSFYEGYLSEYGKLIIPQNALETICEFFGDKT